MRQALNENKTVQIIVIGVMLVGMGLLLITRMGGGGGGETTPPPAPVASEATGAPATGGSVPSGDSAAAGSSVATPAGGSAATEAATPTGDASAAGAAAPAGSGGEVTPAALVPGPGLPADVKRAWNRGSPIALLIVRGGAVADRLVRQSVQALSGSGVAVFVARAKDIARYSRITQGVGVNRVPALVVVRPKSVSGSVPEATVSYGFRSSQSVLQAVDDALYSGKDDLPYHPG
jgi:hypothetical protein